MHNALFFAAPDFPSLVSEAWDPPTKDRAEEGIKYLGLFHVLCYWDPYCSYELAYVSPTLSSAADRPKILHAALYLPYLFQLQVGFGFPDPIPSQSDHVSVFLLGFLLLLPNLLCFFYALEFCQELVRMDHSWVWRRGILNINELFWTLLLLRNISQETRTISYIWFGDVRAQLLCSSRVCMKGTSSSACIGSDESFSALHGHLTSSGWVWPTHADQTGTVNPIVLHLLSLKEVWVSIRSWQSLSFGKQVVFHCHNLGTFGLYLPHKFWISPLFVNVELFNNLTSIPWECLIFWYVIKNVNVWITTESGQRSDFISTHFSKSCLPEVLPCLRLPSASWFSPNQMNTTGPTDCHNTESKAWNGLAVCHRKSGLCEEASSETQKITYAKVRRGISLLMDCSANL